MSKPILIGAFGVVYLLVSAWFIRQEGQAYRLALKEGAPSALADRNVATIPRVDVAPTAPTEPTLPPRPAVPVAPAPFREEAHPPVAQTPAPPAPAIPSPPPPTPSVAATPATPVPPPFTPMVSGPVIADLVHLGREEEAKLGGQLHELVLSRHKTFDAGPWLRRAVDAGRPIAALNPKLAHDYRYAVLDSDEVNAFSHPGGSIYLSRGLFDLAAGTEDLQFLIAHEMAHVELKHALIQAEAAQGGSESPGPGTLQQLYYTIAKGYSEGQEFEADAWAVRRLLLLGLTRRECLGFLRKFVGYAEKHGFENGRKPPKSLLGFPVQDVDNHFRTHPATWERLDRLKPLLAGSR